MQLYPDWSSRANATRGKKRKRKQDTNEGGTCHRQHTHYFIYYIHTYLGIIIPPPPPLNSMPIIFSSHVERSSFLIIIYVPTSIFISHHS